TKRVLFGQKPFGESFVNNRDSRSARIVAPRELAPQHNRGSHRFEVTPRGRVEEDFLLDGGLSVDCDRLGNSAAGQRSDKRKTSGTDAGQLLDPSQKALVECGRA